MKKQSKRIKNLKAKLEDKSYSIKDALKLVLSSSNAKFDESIDVSVRLGIDTKKTDHQARGAAILPHGLGKQIKILVIAQGEKITEAKDAGADYVGSDDMIEKIKNSWLDFDKIIATPDMMASLSKVAKILGPKGLMPNPKVGTVTFDIAKAVEAEKKGKLTFRSDKTGIVHGSFGRKSMGEEALEENLLSFLNNLHKGKPSSSKGAYFRTISLSSTMGPGVLVEPNQAQTQSLK